VALAIVDAFAKFKERDFTPKQSRDPDHAPFGGFFILGVGLAVVDLLAKFKRCSLVHSRNTEGALKFQKRSRDPDHGPFGGKFFTSGLRLAIVDPLANFEECSFIHSRNIEGGG